VRQNRTPDLVGNAAFGQHRLTLHRMIRQGGMYLPVEIVQESRYGPLNFVLPQLPRISRHAGFDGQGVFPQALRLGEFVQNLERLLPGDHSVGNYIYHSPGNSKNGNAPKRFNNLKYKHMLLRPTVGRYYDVVHSH
jgi:hypothetical protein